MPRWRKLHVKATESLDINDMPDDFHRLLWVLMPLGLDREGRGIDNAGWVKAKLMPLRTDVTPEMIEAAMAWYTERRMIVRYEVKGRPYFWVPTFASYQGKTTKEAESEYPAPPEQCETCAGATPDLLQSNSASDADADADADSDGDADADAREGAREPAATAAPDTLAGALFREVEKTGCLLTQIMAESWLESIAPHRDWLKEEDIADAFLEAARSNVPRPGPRYIQSILDRCARDGVRPGDPRRSDPRREDTRRNGGDARARASPSLQPEEYTDAAGYLERALRSG